MTGSDPATRQPANPRPPRARTAHCDDTRDSAADEPQLAGALAVSRSRRKARPSGPMNG